MTKFEERDKSFASVRVSFRFKIQYVAHTGLVSLRFPLADPPSVSIKRRKCTSLALPIYISSVAAFFSLAQRHHYDKNRVNKCFKMNKRNKQSLVTSNRNEVPSECATTTASNDPMQSQSSRSMAGGADSPICVTLGAEPTQCS